MTELACASLSGLSGTSLYSSGICRGKSLPSWLGSVGGFIGWFRLLWPLKLHSSYHYSSPKLKIYNIFLSGKDNFVDFSAEWSHCLTSLVEYFCLCIFLTLTLFDVSLPELTHWFGFEAKCGVQTFRNSKTLSQCFWRAPVQLCCGVCSWLQSPMLQAEGIQKHYMQGTVPSCIFCFNLMPGSLVLPSLPVLLLMIEWLTRNHLTILGTLKDCWILLSPIDTVCSEGLCMVC